MPTEKKQITRNRVSYSCITCRRRKVKCDKVHPICGGCQKAGEECIYGDVEKSGQEQDSTNDQIHVDLPARKRRATNPDIQPQQEFDVPISTVEKIEQKLNQLTTLLHDFNRLTPITNGNSPDSVQTSGPSNSTFRDEVSAYKNLYRTISGMGPSTDRSQNRPGDDLAPWNRVMGKLEHLNSLLLTGVKGHQQSSPLQLHTSNLSNLPSTSDKVYNPYLLNPFLQSTTDQNRGSIRKSSMLQDIADGNMLAPSEQESNVLFRSWLWSTYPVYPIFSPHFVLKKFNAFNKWYRTGLDFGIPNPDPDFMPFIYLIWYTGMLNISEKGVKHWFPWAGEKSTCIPRLRFHLEQSLEGMKCETSPSIYMVAAAVIFHSMTLGAHDMMENCISVTSVIRMAQGLGLHIERPSRQLTEAEAETRRRLWWEAVHLDVSLSCASNMPVVMDECYTDVKMIKELKQSALGTNDALAYERHVEEDGSQPDRPDDPSNNSTTSLVSIYHLVARARYELTIVTKRLLKANMTAEPMTMNEMKELRKSIMDIGKLIRATIDRIQTRGVPELDFVPESAPQPEYDHLEVMGETVTEEEIDVFLRDGAKCNFTTPISKHHRTAMIAFHKWARIYLSMLVDRLDCISYAPFLKNSKSRLWAVARNCALKSCHGFMRKFLGLAEDPQLPRFAWTWPCLFQPMHATVILLIDLHDRPHSDEATRSRAMIDKMFSLAAPYKGRLGVDLLQGPARPANTRDCRSEAWVMLRHLRRKAWQKAGLDPDVLWSEEDQIAVGVGKPLDENELFIRSLREDIILNHRQRQARQSTGGKPLDESRAKTLLDNPNFEAAKGQYLHPSELGPGEQLSGPILQDLAELGIGKETSDVLLLRARRDQELMPFATGPDGREYVVPQNSEGESIIRNRNQNQPHEEGRIVHIGELIKKIQQTKQQSSGAKHPQSVTLSEDNDILTSFAHDTCDFRSIRAAQNAALQDLVEAHSDSQVWPAPSAPPTVNNSSSQNALFSVLSSAEPNPSYEEPRFSFQPSPSPARFGVNLDDSDAGKSMSNELTNHYYNQTVSIPEDSFSLAASIPPTLHNAGFTGRTNIPTKAATVHMRHEQPARSTNTTVPSQSFETKPSEGGSVSIGGEKYNADMEFDWERFDELFGHFGGFEDMLMDGGAAEFEDHHANTGPTHVRKADLPLIY